MGQHQSSKGYRTKADLDNHSNQCNPNNWRYKGHSRKYSGTGTKSDLRNHNNQKNPNNSRYRGGRKKKKHCCMCIC